MLRIKLIVTIIIFSTLYTYAQQADEIIGKYHLPNELDVEIYKDGNTFSGKIIGLNGFRAGQTKDINNPEKSKQDDLIMDMVIIHNIEYNKDKKQ